VNCNRTCWGYPGLEGLKKTLFRLCKANAKILESKPGKYGCRTYMYYRFKVNLRLRHCLHPRKAARQAGRRGLAAPAAA
jgi:hypothetical protein